MAFLDGEMKLAIAKYGGLRVAQEESQEVKQSTLTCKMQDFTRSRLGAR